MSKINLDLSGQFGLAPNFVGDLNDTTAQPQLRYFGEPGQVADGVFDPLRVQGYISPANNTYTALSGTITNEFISREYSASADTTYLAQNGVNLSTISGLDGTTITSTSLLSGTSAFRDLELYQINNQEAVFYTYLYNDSTVSNIPNLNLGYISTDSTKGAFQLAALVFESLPEDETAFELIFSMGNHALAQSFRSYNFTLAPSYTITGIRLRLKTPSIGITQTWTLQVGIQTDIDGLPSGSFVTNASVTIDPNTLPQGNTGYVYFTFSQAVVLSANTEYHIVVQPTNFSDIGANQGLLWMRSYGENSQYADGQIEIYDGTNWAAGSPSDESFDFALILNQYNFVGYTPSIPAITPYPGQTGETGTGYLANAPISYDNSFYYFGSSASSVTQSYTVTSSANRILFIMLRGDSGSHTATITYAGVSMTQYKAFTAGTQAVIYYLYAPATGANNIVITYSGGVNAPEFMVVSYSGVKQTGFPDNTSNTLDGGSSLTTLTNTLTPVGTGAWIVQFYSNFGFNNSHSGGTMRSTANNQPIGIQDTNAVVSGSTSLSVSGSAQTAYNAIAYSLLPVVVPLTFTVTSKQTDNPCLVIGIDINVTADAVSTVTCDGVAMTKGITAADSTHRQYIYTTTGLSIGVHTIVITPSQQVQITANASMYYGVHSSTISETTGTHSSSTSFATTINFSGTKGLAVYFVRVVSVTLTAGTNTVLQSQSASNLETGLFDAPPALIGSNTNNMTANDSTTWSYVTALLFSAPVTGLPLVPAITQTDTNTFLHAAQNGFLYWFTGANVHKLDGGITGGDAGTFTANVLQFPPYFKAIDAVDNNSLAYIAIETSNYTAPDYRTVAANQIGVYSWDYQSILSTIHNYYPAPGAKNMKRIFLNSESDLRLITVGENRFTEIRSLVNGQFEVLFTLGLNAYPITRDALDYIDNMVMWTGGDGYIYLLGKPSIGAKEQIYKVGSLASLVVGTLTPGVFQVGNKEVTQSRDGVLISYKDTSSGNKLVRWYPHGTGTINSVVQKGHAGNVYTLNIPFPSLAKINYIRVYHAPVGTTGATVQGTIKTFVNQSTIPVRTDNVTAADIAKGYQYVKVGQALQSGVFMLQFEISWPTTTTLSTGTDWMPRTIECDYEEITKLY